jgi:hypothetical protein
MMLAEAITVLVNGVWREGRRDADTENGHLFMCELPTIYPVQAGQSVLAAVTCRFEDEGRTWVRGTIDSPAANALRTVMTLRGGVNDTICSACGGRLRFLNAITAECVECGATYP